MDISMAKEWAFWKIEPIRAILYFIAFFIAAIGEELRWQGYAYPGSR